MMSSSPCAALDGILIADFISMCVDALISECCAAFSNSMWRNAAPDGDLNCNGMYAPTRLANTCCLLGVAASFVGLSLGKFFTVISEFNYLLTVHNDSVSKWQCMRITSLRDTLTLRKVCYLNATGLLVMTTSTRRFC